MRTLTITYDKSDEDVAVLCVTEDGIFSRQVIKIFTGEKAEDLYTELTQPKAYVKVESEDKG